MPDAIRKPYDGPQEDICSYLGRSASRALKASMPRRATRTYPPRRKLRHLRSLGHDLHHAFRRGATRERLLYADLDDLCFTLVCDGGSQCDKVPGLGRESLRSVMPGGIDVPVEHSSYLTKHFIFLSL